MRSRGDDIDASMAQAADRVSADLLARGWLHRDLGTRVLATFTRELHADLILGLEVDQPSYGSHRDWPAELGVRVGVGHEPALGLMPLLTLRPSPWLVEAPWPDESRYTVTWPGPDGVDDASRSIVGYVERTSVQLAQQFADLDAVLDALRQRRTEKQPTEYDLSLELTALAASGRHEQARALLADYPADRSEEHSLRQRRFVRQLTRWLDSGVREVPPLADTLALLPAEPRPVRKIWSEARSSSKARSAAIEAVRAQAKGKTLGQIRELVAVEHQRRGLDITAASVTQLASLLQAEQRPFGRLRSAVGAVRALGSFGADSVRLVKAAGGQPPTWLKPPDRASYVLRRSGSTPRVLVQLDADVGDWLTEVGAVARPLGPTYLVDVWLAWESGVLTANVGPRRVGIVLAADAEAYTDVLRAAAVFDEDPVLRGRLSGSGADGWFLEIPCPLRPGDTSGEAEVD